jgi:hypothetical protein
VTDTPRPPGITVSAKNDPNKGAHNPPREVTVTGPYSSTGGSKKRITTTVDVSVLK